ncbi:MAG: hypothetical protein ACKO1J_17765 [Tagaea sp.]
MSAAECAGLYEQFAVGERNDPASAKFARDIGRLTGMCAPREMASAMNDIEAALGTGLEESAILLYADALLNVGQGKRAAPLVRSAVAISLTANQESAGPFANFEASAPWLLRAIDRTSAALDSGNARRIAGELEAFLSRSPRAPRAEARLVSIALARLEKADARESLYWRGRFNEWVQEFRPTSPRSVADYSVAVTCGDRRAMLRLGALYLAGEADEVWGRQVYFGLALVENPTAKEREMLGVLEPQFGQAPLDMTDPLVRESRALFDRLGCQRALRAIAGRNG